jgi:hypothetical protein
MGDAELAQHKRAMEVEYNKAHVGKSDPNFQYDVRMDFSNKKKDGDDENNSWDDSVYDDDFENF